MDYIRPAPRDTSNMFLTTETIFKMIYEGHSGLFLGGLEKKRLLLIYGRQKCDRDV